MPIYPDIDPTRIGIYAIKHTTSGKRYIGSTVESFKKRWKEHVRDLKYNRHHSPYLQRAWNKYGEDQFVIEILEESRDRKYIRAREMELILLHKTWEKHLGNNINAHDASGFSATGKAHVAIDPEGNIHQISSLKTFCFHRGLDYHAMRRTRSGKYLHHRGWRCYYELPECIDSPDEFKIKIKQALKNKVKKAKSIQVGNAACAVVDPFGVHYEVTGMKDFCSLHDLDKAEMISVKSGRLPHHRRWRAYPVGAEIPDHEEFWKRHDGKIREMYKNRANTKPKINDWIVTSPNGEISRISNLSRFCKERNLIPANMRQACLMNRLHKGWKIEKP